MRLVLKDLRHWKFKFELMRFGVLILIVVLFWVGIELYSTYNSTAISEDYSKQIEPLNPALDLEVLEQLDQRVDSPTDFEIIVNADNKTSPPPKATPVSTPRPTQSTSTQSGQPAQEGV